MASLGHPWFTHYLVRVDGVPGRGRPARDVRGRELPVVDRDRRLGARARPRQPRHPDRGGRGRRRRQRMDVSRGLRRQRRRDRRLRASRVRARGRAGPGPAPRADAGAAARAARGGTAGSRAAVAPADADARLVALGWATVDLERALPALRPRPGRRRTTRSWRPPSRSPSARAAGWRRRSCPAARPWPSSSRRPRAAWRRPSRGSARAPSIAWYAGLGRRPRRRDGPPGPGRSGPERLVGGDPVHGPHRLLIEGAPGTIAP